MTPAGSAEGAAPADGVIDSPDGETVILDLKPHPLYILIACGPHLLAVAAVCAVLLWIVSQGIALAPSRGILSVALMLALARLLWQALDWAGRRYVLTDRRVIRDAGVLRRFHFEAALGSIQHVNVQRTLSERLTGLGTIGFATSGTGMTEAYWISVASPDEVAARVRQTLDRYGRRGG